MLEDSKKGVTSWFKKYIFLNKVYQTYREDASYKFQVLRILLECLLEKFDHGKKSLLLEWCLMLIQKYMSFGEKNLAQC